MEPQLQVIARSEPEALLGADVKGHVRRHRSAFRDVGTVGCGRVGSQARTVNHVHVEPGTAQAPRPLGHRRLIHCL